jgi:hypothetical protein
MNPKFYRSYRAPARNRCPLVQQTSCPGALHLSPSGEWPFQQTTLKSKSCIYAASLHDFFPSRMMAYPYPQPYPSPTQALDYTFGRPSFATVVRQTYATDGLAGFFRGLTPTILRAFPVNASALFVYEGVLRLLNAEEVRVKFDFFGFSADFCVRHAINDNEAIDLRSPIGLVRYLVLQQPRNKHSRYIWTCHLRRSSGT